MHPPPPPHTVNARPVRILLECILVNWLIFSLSASFENLGSALWIHTRHLNLTGLILHDCAIFSFQKEALLWTRDHSFGA